MSSKGENILNFGQSRRKVRAAKKAEQKTDKDRKAAENRIRHGRTGAERRQARADAEKAGKALDGKALSKTPAEAPETAE